MRRRLFAVGLGVVGVFALMIPAASASTGPSVHQVFRYCPDFVWFCKPFHGHRIPLLPPTWLFDTPIVPAHAPTIPVA